MWLVIGRDLGVEISTGAHIKMASRSNIYLNFPNRRATDSKYLIEKIRAPDASAILTC